jgi:hypothetical protein
MNACLVTYTHTYMDEARLSKMLAILLLLLGATGHAAEIVFVEPATIVWTGEFALADYDKFIRVAEQHPRFTTLKLIDAGDGDASVTRWMIWTVRGPGIDVVVDGACIAACASIFINASRRQFPSRPLTGTYLHVKGAHDAGTGALVNNLGQSAALASELSARTGGKLSLELAFKALRLPDPRGGLLIYALPRKSRSGTAQVFFCNGPEPVKPDACDEIKGATPQSLGIVGSREP